MHRCFRKILLSIANAVKFHTHHIPHQSNAGPAHNPRLLPVTFHHFAAGVPEFLTVFLQTS